MPAPRTLRPRRAPRGAWDGPVVAIGGSAGALKSLQQLLGALPPDFPAAVLVVLHIQHDRPPGLANVLQQRSALPVREATDGEALQRGVVLVAKPDRHLEVRAGRVRLSQAPAVHFSRPSVDTLFASVARGFRDRAVAVVLSGSGADGRDGVVRVKAEGGTVLAEDPASAAYPSMPEAAVASGAVDATMPAARLGQHLAKAVAGRPGGPAAAPSQWKVLLMMLRRRFGTDFAGYKNPTLRRRLDRRLTATGQPDLGAYLRHIQDHPGELDHLHSAFLLKVSSFFRDRAAWQALDTVAKQLAHRGGNGDIRVWSAGCATGEEAYSLAILFLEALPPRDHARLKVFATDVDDEALATARAGRYTAAQLATLTPAQRQKYFTPAGDAFQVNRDLRSRVIFGRHDLTRDPPIAGVDVLACRNVLIYLDAEAKRALLERFSYAVRPGGHLFLGKSEGVAGHGDLFKAVAAEARLFRKGAALAPVPVPPLPPRERQEDAVQGEIQAGLRELTAQAAFRHLLLRQTTVAVVAVDANRRVTLWNRGAEKMLGVKAARAEGRPLLDVLEGLSADKVGAAVKQAASRNVAVALPGLPCRVEGAERFLDLDVSPLERQGRGRGVLLLAVDATGRREAEARQAELLADLRKVGEDSTELTESLSAANEELETLNEELQSTSEEQQTLNEELQSRNEELETLNEELQSTNEELTTLNDELRSRAEETERLSAYLRAVIATAGDDLIACDAKGCITIWTAGAARRFRLSEAQAVGQDVFSIVPALDLPPLREAVREAALGKDRVSLDAPVGPPGARLRVEVVTATDGAGRRPGYLLILRDAAPAPEPTAARGTGPGPRARRRKA